MNRFSIGTMFLKRDHHPMYAGRNIKHRGKHRGGTWSLLLVVLVVVVGGCRHTDIGQLEDLQAVSLFTRMDQLPRTMSYVQSLERFDQQEFRRNVASGLNRWVNMLDDEQRRLPSWEPASDWLDTLPPAIDRDRWRREMTHENFHPSDAYFIQEAYWLSAISRRLNDDPQVINFNWWIEVAKSRASADQVKSWQDSDDLLGDVFAVLHPELREDSEGASQLARAVQLFDWTIRNIQARPVRDWPAAEEIAQQALVRGDRVTSDSWPPAVGVVGPGYHRFPWQLMMYGRGDPLERANLFLGLLHQAGIDGVMLAVHPTPGESESGNGPDAANTRPYVEWLPAVLIGGQFYLFDTELGIPLPGEALGQIATLEQVRAKPELLTQLDLSVDESIDRLDYRVRPGQVDSVIGLLCVPPESLYRRMRLLEDNLTGEDLQMALTRDVAGLAERVEQAGALDQIALWHVPFSVHGYREVVNTALEQRMGGDTRLQQHLRWYFEEEQYIDLFAYFRSAKNLYLRGIFESPRHGRRANALNVFSRFIYTDEEIAIFELDTMLQSSLGIFQAQGQSYAEWNRQLSIMKDQMQRVRGDAAFFLALCHAENGYPSTALNWLNRIDMYDRDARWISSVGYQMGRAHEALGEYQPAIRLYRRQGSPQRQGNVIRARLLEQQM